MFKTVPILWTTIDWLFRWGIIILLLILNLRISLFFLISLKLRSLLYSKLSITITDTGLIYRNSNINWNDITSITYNYAYTTICTMNKRIIVPGLPELKITKIIENAGLNHYKFLFNRTVISKTPGALLKVEKPVLSVKFISLLQCILFVLLGILIIVDVLLGDIGNLYMRLAVIALLCSLFKAELYELERVSFRDALARLSTTEFTVNHEGIYISIKDKLIPWENITSINKSLATITLIPVSGEQFKIPNNLVISNLVDHIYTKKQACQRSY